ESRHGRLVGGHGGEHLSHVSKDRILSVVTQAASAGKAEAMRNLKKDQLVQKADEELSGLRWLPDNLKAGAQ
ncbi:MAG: hypothetical protein M3Y27_12750, partial [Acidobacteriota bacterium]|nr:hypothetical protein [Acidobacteriota bacterium]